MCNLWLLGVQSCWASAQGGFLLKVAVEILRYVSLVAYVALALATINQWRRQRNRAAAWAALCFGMLGLVVVLGQRQLVPEHPQGFFENFLQRLDVAFLLLFPRTSCSGSTSRSCCSSHTCCTGSRPCSGRRRRDWRARSG